MSTKYLKILYFLVFILVHLIFAQTLKKEESLIKTKEGNLIKLNDGRIIEINEQLMEDYFFFEIDNPKPPDQENDFDNKFDNSKNNSKNNQDFTEGNNQRLLNKTENISTNEQPYSYSSSPIEISQSIQAPPNASTRGNYNSKYKREGTDKKIDDDIQYFLNNSRSNQKLRDDSDTRSFDLNKRPITGSQSTSSTPSTPKTQTFNLKDGTPNSNLETKSRNQQSSADISNIRNQQSSGGISNINNNNNNISLNLYNLTNLLDQIFNKNNTDTKKSEEWKRIYRKIIENDAFEFINNSTLKEFIIKLHLLYELVYGNEYIRPPNKITSAKPNNTQQQDEEDRYKALLEKILKSFPDINNKTINVIIISNTSYQTPTRDIDRRYQKEFNNMQKTYNYNIGLELANIKNLFTKQKYSLLLKKLHKLEEIEPYNTRIKNIIGSAYYKIGFYEFAEQYWQESLNLNPNQPIVEAYLSKIRDYGYNSDSDFDTIENY